jgi:ABC-type Mn2+/Zn2+ transport system permease subunit
MMVSNYASPLVIPFEKQTVFAQNSWRHYTMAVIFLVVGLSAFVPVASAQDSSLDRAVEELNTDAPKEPAPADASKTATKTSQETTSNNRQGHDHSDAEHHASHADKHQPHILQDDVHVCESGNAVQLFIASWSLFQNGYLLGWLAGLVLALVGVIVVARDQVFIGAAVSQASTLGIAVALCAGSSLARHYEGAGVSHDALWLCCDSFQVTMAVLFSVLAALITSRANRATHESHEAITGWVFLVSASLSVLLVAHSPHGLEEITRIHSSSIIGATALDVQIFAGLLLLTILFISIAGRRLILFVTDPSMASSVGMNVGRWAAFESIWLGLVVGLSIRASGMLFTFGSLVLPALVAKNVCREVRPMFFIAPIVAFLANLVGFVLANRYDFPPAQMNVALLCLMLLLAWGIRRFRRG